MRGPIDYLIVQFHGNNFKGEVLDELAAATEKGIIGVLDLAVIVKDKEGNVTSVELSNLEGEVVDQVEKTREKMGTLITEEDIEEVTELLDNDTAVGLLIIEQLWAIGLKKALINAGATLVSEGRIHPEAAEELNK
jgi:hypothetical protein